MEKHVLKFLGPGVFAAAAFALALGAGAQTTAPVESPAAAKSSQTVPMNHHQKDGAAMAKREADMKAKCQVMMAKKQEMKDKLQAMDAKLDELVAEMNAAKDSKEPDAMEKPMAAVINELVAQRKATRAMMMEMQSEMMTHMMDHMALHGTKGAMKCPMMKSAKAPAPKAEEKMPTM